jgi:hypothetical protein
VAPRLALAITDVAPQHKTHDIDYMVFCQMRVRRVGFNRCIAMQWEVDFRQADTANDPLVNPPPGHARAASAWRAGSRQKLVKFKTFRLTECVR